MWNSVLWRELVTIWVRRGCYRLFALGMEKGCRGELNLV
jgi:hypothetical protein